MYAVFRINSGFQGGTLGWENQAEQAGLLDLWWVNGLSWPRVKKSRGSIRLSKAEIPTTADFKIRQNQNDEACSFTDTV
jgi:hypothetical protein